VRVWPTKSCTYLHIRLHSSYVELNQTTGAGISYFMTALSLSLSLSPGMEEDVWGDDSWDDVAATENSLPPTEEIAVAAAAAAAAAASQQSDLWCDDLWGDVAATENSLPATEELAVAAAPAASAAAAADLQVENERNRPSWLRSTKPITAEERHSIDEDLIATLGLKADTSTYPHAGPLFIDGRLKSAPTASKFDPAAYEIRPPYVFLLSVIAFSLPLRCVLLSLFL
jgi:hypothetical protein